ncbi:MAG: DUF1553 domain-containing protein [Verrucomicrobiales bacterium]|nr:DUF1553 domain-containing protein [Verrucomicrobiales bacterium]
MRPILSENCFHCHGPDAEARKADLRMDTEEATRADLGGYAAIVPGDLENSEAWLRIDTDDPDDVMPPPKSKRELTVKQKKLLKRWIESGGKFENHWAYEKPVRPKVPKAANAIDHFVRDRLTRENLNWSEQADARAVIRRASFDLIGLPPSIEEVETFEKEAKVDFDTAYEKLVERLLASPRFGEKWARPWLDLARYADSNGFQADQIRDSWAYRDWVISALNKNMPFDQFTIEQLAGDLLPNATLENQIATGFHRTVTCNVEAGVHPEENRTNQVVDRVNTTGTVWLGTTMECAQCHDHKYDPFTMKDYYGIFAYFNNTPLEVRNPSGKGVSFDFYGPKMDLPMSEDKEARRKTIAAQLEDLQAERKVVAATSKKERVKWESRLMDALKTSPEWQVLEIAEFKGSREETFQDLKDGSILVTGPIPDKSTYTVKVRTKLAGIRAIKIETLTHDSLPAKGPARGNGNKPNSIITEAKLAIGEPGGKSARVQLHSAAADFSQTGWPASGAIDGDAKTGWAINPQFGKDHWIILQTGEGERGIGKEGIENELTLTLDQNYGGERVIGRLRISVTTDEPGAEALDTDLMKILSKNEGKRSKAETKKLDDYFAKENPGLKVIDQKTKQAQAKLKAVTPDSTLVMIEMEEPRETFVMKRGNYLDTAEKVEARPPEILHPIDPNLPANRLGFAKWLMDADNPLVARVTVNRWWSQIFGLGIVRTVEDFGVQAEPPTHPELLDWLAVEFVESGWDMKHILKTIVMSETYRQSSRVTDEMLEIDPENRLLARGSRFRMSAEMIRDNILTVSGLLSTKMHGPPIMPYQPAGMWRQVGRNEPKWIEAKNENRWRRGIYVIWRRAAPYPSFVNFDGPDRSACVVQRPRTNTPLQALTLLNDPVYTEAALALADRVLTEKADAKIEDQIGHAFELVFNREPVSGEREHLKQVFESRLAKIGGDAKTADELIRGASSVYQPKSDPKWKRELAAWYFVANILLNLDEVVTKG